MAVMINGKLEYVGRTLKVRDTYRMDMFCEAVTVLNENDEEEFFYVHDGPRPEVDATPEVIALAESKRAERMAKAEAERQKTEAEYERLKREAPITNRYLSQDEIHKMARAVLSDLEIHPLSRADKIRVAADYARDELRVNPRESACKLAVKLAEASWDEIKLSVRRAIA